MGFFSFEAFNLVLAASATVALGHMINEWQNETSMEQDAAVVPDPCI